MPRTLQITVSTRAGRTHIRAFEDLSQIVGGLFGGLGAGAGVGGGTLVAALVKQATHSPTMIIVGLLTTLGVSLASARTFFRRSSMRKQEEIEQIVRRVGERILMLRG